jgi:hypothetical protein
MEYGGRLYHMHSLMEGPYPKWPPDVPLPAGLLHTLLSHRQLNRGETPLDFKYKCYVRLGRLVTEAYATLLTREWFLAFSDSEGYRFRDDVDGFWAHVRQAKTGAEADLTEGEESEWFNLSVIADSLLELLEYYQPAATGGEAMLRDALVSKTQRLIEDMTQTQKTKKDFIL